LKFFGSIQLVKKFSVKSAIHILFSCCICEPVDVKAKLLRWSSRCEEHWLRYLLIGCERAEIHSWCFFFTFWEFYSWWSRQDALFFV